MSYKDPRCFSLTASEKVIHTIERIPYPSALEFRLQEVLDKDPESCPSIDSLKSHLKQIGMMGKDQEINVKNMSILLINTRKARGIYLAIHKPEKNTTIDLPGALLDGDSPYVGVFAASDNSVKFCMSAGNEFSKPSVIDLDLANEYERNFMYFLQCAIAKLAPRQTEDFNSDFVPSMVFNPRDI
jgi:hypothetical protein